MSTVDDFAYASYVHCLEAHSEHFCTPISVWAIRQKSTGYFLPARSNGRGYSFDEPTKDCFPRLFESEICAKRALSAWLQGEWQPIYERNEWNGQDYKIGAAPVKVESRNSNDMEIVEFALYEVTK